MSTLCVCPESKLGLFSTNVAPLTFKAAMHQLAALLNDVLGVVPMNFFHFSICTACTYHFFVLLLVLVSIACSSWFSCAFYLSVVLATSLAFAFLLMCAPILTLHLCGPGVLESVLVSCPVG